MTVSIADIKSRIDLRAYVARDMGKATDRGGTLFFRCPFHKNGTEKTPSLAVYPDHFHCYGCEAHGDVVDYVQRRQHIGIKEALDFLANELQLSPLPNLPPPKKIEVAPTILTKDEIVKYQANLPKVKPYLDERTIFEQWLIDRRELGGRVHWTHYTDKLGEVFRFEYNYVCLPYTFAGSVYSQNFRRDDTSCKRALAKNDLYDHLLGDIAVKDDLEPEDITQEYFFSRLFGPRFQRPKGTRTSAYGVDQVIQKDGDKILYPRTPYAIITEGEFNALSCMEYGYTAVALKPGQGVNVKRLFQNTRILYIAVDNDEAGRTYANRILEDLGSARVQARLMTMPDGFNDLNDLAKAGRLISFLSKRPYYLDPIGI